MRLRLGVLLRLAVPVIIQAQSAGETAVRGIHARWTGRTYKTLTFVQETRFGDGRTETWFESTAAEVAATRYVRQPPSRATASPAVTIACCHLSSVVRDP